MGKDIKSCRACQRILAGLVSFAKNLRNFKLVSVVWSVISSGLIFRFYSSDELLRYAAGMHNRCLGAGLKMATQLLLLGQSPAGRILLAYALSAGVAAAFLRRQELFETQELGAALYLSIMLVGVGVALKVGVSVFFWSCIP